MSKSQNVIGVFGGTGFYSLLENATQALVETPYGSPSGKLITGQLAGQDVVFMARHGDNHEIPPHKINYRANIYAMHQAGVTRLISPCAAGSLVKDVKPGDFVFCDQYVDRTKNRIDTFYDGPISTHVSAANPYCNELRQIAINEAKSAGINGHAKGNIVIIEGPRFSSKAESKWYSSMGWEVINMTQYPEVHLARELEMCTLNISLITDYDAGLIDDIEPVSHEQVMQVFSKNLSNLKILLEKIISKIPDQRTKCDCSTTLKHARIT